MQKEFSTPFEGIYPQELNNYKLKFYLSARKSDEHGHSPIAHQIVIIGNSKRVKNHIFVINFLTVLV